MTAVLASCSSPKAAIQACLRVVSSGSTGASVAVAASFMSNATTGRGGSVLGAATGASAMMAPASTCAGEQRGVRRQRSV